MRKLNAILAAPVILLAASACSSFSNRGEVERPFIESANQYNFSVEKVVLTDSSTVLHAVTHFYPGQWIRIAESSFIEADGVKYPLSGAEGIAIGEEVWMPDSGVIHFTLSFPGIPSDTKNIDFSEGIDNGWQIWGIDLTGEADDDINLDKVPSWLLRHEAVDEYPEPELTFGDSATVKVHILGYRQSMGGKLNWYANTAHGQQEGEPVSVDEDGNAVIRLSLSAPAAIIIMGFDSNNSAFGGSAYVSPGETIDMYPDSHVTGLWNMSMRDTGTFGKKKEFGKKKDFVPVYASGRYSGVDKSRGENLWVMQVYNGYFGDYHMNGDEYTNHIIELYHNLSDSIAHDPTIDAAGRKLWKATLNADLINAAIDAKRILRNNYYMVHHNWGSPVDADSIPVELSPENVKKIASLVDFNDMNLFLALKGLGTLPQICNTDLWKKHGIDPGVLEPVRLYNEAYGEATNARLDTAKVAALRKYYPGMADEVEAHYKACKARIDNLDKTRLTPTPDVANDKLFEAIVAPHKGKVVMVDFWNTWCGPCRGALAANEPLKDGELSSDDIVWIYIADESSPEEKYFTMINDIKGIHYRLTGDQITFLRQQFDVDGIPYYVLVDRQGKAEGRPDLRDHAKFVEAVKGKL